MRLLISALGFTTVTARPAPGCKVTGRPED